MTSSRQGGVRSGLRGVISPGNRGPEVDLNRAGHRGAGALSTLSSWPTMISVELPVEHSGERADPAVQKLGDRGFGRRGRWWVRALRGTG